MHALARTPKLDARGAPRANDGRKNPLIGMRGLNGTFTTHRLGIIAGLSYQFQSVLFH